MADPTTMTDEALIAEAQRLDTRATPGPWLRTGSDKTWRPPDPGAALLLGTYPPCRGNRVYSVPSGGTFPSADIDLVVFARYALPELARRLKTTRNAALEEAAAVVDQCNREGPYNAIGAAARIRALKAKEDAAE